MNPTVLIHRLEARGALERAEDPRIRLAEPKQVGCVAMADAIERRHAVHGAPMRRVGVAQTRGLGAACVQFIDQIRHAFILAENPRVVDSAEFFGVHAPVGEGADGPSSAEGHLRPPDSARKEDEHGAADEQCGRGHRRCSSSPTC